MKPELGPPATAYGEIYRYELVSDGKVDLFELRNNLRKNIDAACRAGDRKLIESLDAHKAYRDRLAHVIEFESDYWRTLNKLNAAVSLRANDPNLVPRRAGTSN